MTKSYKQRKAFRQHYKDMKTRPPATASITMAYSKLTGAPMTRSEPEMPSEVATMQQASADRRNVPITLPRISMEKSQ